MKTGLNKTSTLWLKVFLKERVYWAIGSKEKDLGHEVETIAALPGARGSVSAPWTGKCFSTLSSQGKDVSCFGRISVGSKQRGWRW